MGVDFEDLAPSCCWKGVLFCQGGELNKDFLTETLLKGVVRRDCELLVEEVRDET